MKLSLFLISLAFAAPSFVLAEECEGSRHHSPPCEDNVDSPEFVETPSPTNSPTTSPTSSPTLAPTASPTQAPTENPTISPSTLPTGSPTASPSSTPTAMPTLPPTASPTSTPTSTPTLSPTSSPTDAPTGTPSTIPTAAPSDFPSVAPTEVPSFSPTSSPSSAPTSASCKTSGGVFGDIGSEVVSVIDYAYELEYNATEEYLESILLPVLEQAVADSVLSEVFVDCAGRRNLRVTRRLSVTGVSVNPVDTVLDNVICSDVAEGNSCVVVSGEMTLYSDGEDTAMADSVKSSIKDNMDVGLYDDVDPASVRVSYVDLDSNNNSGSSGATGNDTALSNDKNSVLIGVLVAAGVVMTGTLGVIYRRRMSADGEEYTTAIGEQSTVAS